MKIKANFIDKIIISVFLICLVIANIFLIFELKYKYVNIEDVYKINKNIHKIIIYDISKDKYIKIDDTHTISKIYEEIGKIKVRNKYENMYIKMYNNRNNNIYFNIYENDIQSTNCITIYNKLIIIDGKCYVCDIDISKYIKKYF